MQVTTLADFEQALRLALHSTTRFSLIEVMLPAGSRTARLDNFANGFKAAQAAQAQC